MTLEERNDVVIVSGSEEEIKKLKESPNLKRGEGVCIMKEDLQEVIPDAPKVYTANIPQDEFYKEKIGSQAREIQNLTEELAACHKKIAHLDEELIAKKLRIHKLEAALVEAAIR